MDYKKIAKSITNLKNKDLQFRSQLIEKGLLGEGYHPEMEALHNSNAKILNYIIDSIGYPTINKVGAEASEAAWLIIQHSIGQPEFMRKCVKLLEKAVAENNADPINFAYLTDRIATSEGKLQIYGTQFDWNADGELSPLDFDDLDMVNKRRKSIGLNSIEEQTIIIRERANSENQSPPADFKKRQQDIKIWQKKAGWIK